MRNQIKGVIFRLLIMTRVSRLLTIVFSSKRPLNEDSWLCRIPFSGEFELMLDEKTGIRIHANGTDSVATRLWWSGLQGHEPETLLQWSELCKNNTRAGVVLDIGAYNGLFSLIAAALAPELSVYSFEPFPAARDALQANIQINNFSDRVHIVPVALSDHNDTTRLYFRPGHAMSGGSSENPNLDPIAISYEVQARRLDDISDTWSDEPVRLIKIDVETTEDRVLLGGATLIKTHKPIIVCEVFEGYTEHRIQELIAPLGYKFFNITPDGLIQYRTLRGFNDQSRRNWVFTPVNENHPI